MQIIVYHNNEPVKTYGFSDFPVTVGRLQENEIPIADINISRRHIAINHPGPGRYTVVDLNSLNGAFLNKSKIEKETLLANGDRIVLGSFQLEVRLPTEPDTLAVIDDVHSEPVESTIAPVASVVPAAGLAQSMPMPLSVSDHEPTPKGIAAQQVVFSSVVASEPDSSVLELPSDSSDAVLIDIDQHLVYKLDKSVITIGKDTGDDIYADGPWITENHVAIELDAEGAFWITARKMMGKFKVNGEKSGRHKLVHKDRIEIGDKTFRFMENGQKAS